MRIHILYDFRLGPWGGGNQFLKALKGALIEMGVYEDIFERADVIIFNSHHFGEDYKGLEALYRLKHDNPKARFIHRVDGPIQLYRGSGAKVDRLIFEANSILADATVFQTAWSCEQSLQLGLAPARPYGIFLNAPDPSIFHPPKKPRGRGEKLKIIATSWAANMNKGFDVYQYLDQALDFSKYEMTFIGNSPIEFKNIRKFPPMKSADLADQLRGHDVFITASQNDPCSNSLTEALHCGLPALIRNSGGHSEIVREAACVFNDKADVLAALVRMEENYEAYRAAINMPSIGEIAQNYADFAKSLTEPPKVLSAEDAEKLKVRLKRAAFFSRIEGGIKRRLGMAS